MQTTPNPDLHYKDVGRDFVFLDLSRDRYFLLQGSPADRFRCYLAGSSSEDDLAWLLEKKIICPATALADRLGSSFPASPHTSLLETGRRHSPRLLSITRAIGSLIASKHAIKRDGLRISLEKLSKRRPRNSAADFATATEHVSLAFEATSRYIRSIDQCLPRSIAMTGLLYRQGVPASLVIGVKLPFAAHCWVQVGDELVSDPLDEVLQFQPIFAL